MNNTLPKKVSDTAKNEVHCIFSFYFISYIGYMKNNQNNPMVVDSNIQIISVFNHNIRPSDFTKILKKSSKKRILNRQKTTK